MDVKTGKLCQVCDTSKEAKAEMIKYNNQIGSIAIKVIKKNNKFEIWNFAITTIEEKIENYVNEHKKKSPRIYDLRKNNLTKQSAMISLFLIVVGLFTGIGFFIMLPLSLINLWLSSRIEHKRISANFYKLKKLSLHFAIYERSARLFHKKYYYTEKDFKIAEEIKTMALKGQIDKRILNEKDVAFLIKLINDRNMFEKILNSPNEDILKKRRKRFFDIIDAKAGFYVISDDLDINTKLNYERFNETHSFIFLDITTNSFDVKPETFKAFSQSYFFI